MRPYGVGGCSNLSGKEEWERFYTPVLVFSRACGFHMNTITVANNCIAFSSLYEKLIVE